MITHIKLDKVDSTNSYLKQNRSQLPDGTLVTAGLQTAGRGRRGHSWAADRGMLPFSLLLKNPPYPDCVTLCAGVAVCRALESAVSGESFGIKWPNDIILRGFKLCGILCESVYSGDNIDIICGIGVNLSQSEEFFKQAELPHAASLKMLTGAVPEREALALDISERLYKFTRSGFAAIYGEYKSRCLTLGKTVKIIENGRERTAFAQDIAENGRLICADENGSFEVNSGEVSVRGLLGYI